MKPATMPVTAPARPAFAPLPLALAFAAVLAAAPALALDPLGSDALAPPRPALDVDERSAPQADRRACRNPVDPVRPVPIAAHVTGPECYARS